MNDAATDQLSVEMIRVISHLSQFVEHPAQLLVLVTTAEDPEASVLTASTEDYDVFIRALEAMKKDGDSESAKEFARRLKHGNTN